MGDSGQSWHFLDLRSSAMWRSHRYTFLNIPRNISRVAAHLTYLRHLLGNRQDSGQGLDTQGPHERLGFLKWTQQAKTFIRKHSANKRKHMQALNRDELRVMAGLLKGHWHLKGHLFEVELVNSPRCGRCLDNEESASHTYPMWLWGNSSCKISSHGSLLHGMKRLPWRPHKDCPALHRKCRSDKEINRKRKHNGSSRSQCKSRKARLLYTYCHALIVVWLIIRGSDWKLGVVAWLTTTTNYNYLNSLLQHALQLNLPWHLNLNSSAANSWALTPPGPTRWLFLYLELSLVVSEADRNER
jgi:hypothetical protein